MDPVRRRFRLPFVDLPIPHGLRFFFLAVVASVDLVAVAVVVPVVAVAAVVVLAAVDLVADAVGVPVVAVSAVVVLAAVDLVAITVGVPVVAVAAVVLLAAVDLVDDAVGVPVVAVAAVVVLAAAVDVGAPSSLSKAEHASCMIVLFLAYCLDSNIACLRQFLHDQDVMSQLYTAKQSGDWDSSTVDKRRSTDFDDDMEFDGDKG